MHVFKTQIDLQAYLQKNAVNKSIGFTPTMGALHKGHFELINTSIKACDISICSIFINPTQFNNIDDLNNYPKTLDDDIKKLRELNCDILYAPEKDDLYKDNEQAKKYEFSGLENEMEGKYRPGHFNGVATIIEKLFNIINPTYAYFGQKDLQQVQIIKKLVTQKKIKTKIVRVSTVRDTNGLAMSSRNARLNDFEKKKATFIYQNLLECKTRFPENLEVIKKDINTAFKNNPYLKLEYIAFVDLNSLRPIKDWLGKGENAVCIAAYLNNIRLSI